MKEMKNQRGLTLVELLAALVILSIISLSLFTFFIQASSYNTQNKNKLVAINIARGVTERLNDYTEIKEAESKGSFTYERCLSSGGTNEYCTSMYRTMINNLTYHIEIIVEDHQTTGQFHLPNGSLLTQGIGYSSQIRVLLQDQILAELGSVIQE